MRTPIVAAVADGTTNYTRSQVFKKARVLKRAGFGFKDIRKMMGLGIVWLTTAEYLAIAKQIRYHMDKWDDPWTSNRLYHFKQAQQLQDKLDRHNKEQRPLGPRPRGIHAGAEAAF